MKRIIYTTKAITLLARLAMHGTATNFFAAGESKASLIRPILEGRVRLHWMHDRLAGY